MSLINDMLRDLETRQANGLGMNFDSSEQEEVSLSRGKTYAAMLFLLIVIIFIGQQLWFFWGEGPSHSTPLSQALTYEKSVFQNSTVSEEIGEVKIPAVDWVARNVEIASLLQQAQEALSEDRLSLPKQNNAVTMYRQVLEWDSTNKEAIQGLAQVVDRYRVLIDHALANGNSGKAKALLGRVKTLGMDAEEQRVLWRNIEALQVERERLSSNDGDESPSEPVAISMSWEFKDQQTSQTAQVLFSKNQGDEARKLLEKFVEQSPYVGLCFQQLFQNYLLIENYSLAKSLVTEHTQLPVAKRAYLLSRIDVAQGQVEHAITKLERQKPGNSLFQAYYGLLAALYQKTDRHLKAVEYYQQLLKMDNKQPDYWLGLGISLDALDKRPEALRAFQLANQFVQANPRIESYIRQRIQALSS